MALLAGFDADLVSKRDRMVSIYRPSDNPIHRDGMELVATVTVELDPDGSVSVGLGYNPANVVKVQYIDDRD